MTKSLLGKRKPLSRFRPENASHDVSRTYREQLYSGRRITLNPGQNSSWALGRVFQAMREEGLVDHIRSKREWIRPGLAASLKRMKRRQQRFNAIVRSTINEINDIYRRLQ